MRYLTPSVVVALLTLLLATSQTASAQIVNGSFESATIPNQNQVPVGSTAITGWVVVNGPLDYDGSIPPDNPAIGVTPDDGDHCLDLGGTPGEGGIEQSFSTVPGVSYLLSFALSGNPTQIGESNNKTMRVIVGAVTQDYAYNVALKGNTRQDMRWEHDALSFTATDSTTTLRFVSTMGSVFTGPELDNVSVAPIQTSAPEPTSFAFALLVLCLAAGVRRFYHLPVFPIRQTVVSYLARVRDLWGGSLQGGKIY